MELTIDSTLEEVRKFVDTIPEENIITDYYVDKQNSFKGCIIGQINRVVKGNAGDPYDSELESKLRTASTNFIADLHIGFFDDIADVNNGTNKSYQQETPKARSLALIDDMIKAGITL